MKRTMVFAFFAVLVVCAGCAQEGQSAAKSDAPASKLTRESLLAHGFKKSGPPRREIYELETSHLVDVLRDLGLSLAQLQPSPSTSPWMDWREVALGRDYLRVESLVVDEKGIPVAHSLDNPNAKCKVRVWFDEISTQTYQKTDSSPRVRIKSVTVSKDRSKPLDVTFELAAEGTTPLGLKSKYFYVELWTPGKTLRRLVASDLSFPKGTPDKIMISPGKPITLTATTSSSSWSDTSGAPWTGLPVGEFVLQVEINSDKDEPGFDYHWTGIERSDDYKLVIK
jgi:hypothetical protein